MNGISRGLLAASLLLPALSEAQQPQTVRPQSPQFSYSYVELGYDESDFGTEDGDGLTLSGSFEINDEWHAFASYGSANLDGGFDTDVDTWAIGAGYVFPLRENVDLYGRVLYLDREVDFPGFGGFDDDGLGLQFRIRALVTDEVELEGGIQYVDVGDNDTSLQAGARYRFSPKLSAGVGFTFGGDTDGIGINARFSF